MKRVALSLSLLLGCVDFGGPTKTLVSGRLTVGPGVIFLERGHVQQGIFERAGTIGADGRFSVELPAGGTWGVHLYVAGYFYLPLELDVRAGLNNPVEQPNIDWSTIRMGPAWGASGEQPPDPGELAPIPDTDPTDNPVIMNPAVHRVAPDTYQASVDAIDPNGTLSRQVLVFSGATGAGVALNPPAAPVDENYPNGTYQATIYLPAGADPAAPWYFVAANHGCSSSSIFQVTAQ